jgi:hypothetical protein
MKIIELDPEFNLALSNEEYSLLRRFFEGVQIAKAELDERNQHVANQLVNKSALLRIRENGQTFYKRSSSTVRVPGF